MTEDQLKALAEMAGVIVLFAGLAAVGTALGVALYYLVVR